MKTVGEFTIVEELARGGAGVVYRARDPRLQRDVAVKLLLGGSGASDAQRRRFQREAELLARVRHPNVVHVHATGVHEGNPYLVLDLLSGSSLQEELDRKGPYASRDAATTALQIARGLEHLHAQGVLHRDLKPANVVLDADGEAVITDLGLAKDLDLERSQLTQTGRALGTPGYWAPEQARGDLDAVGTHTDVYGLGAILYVLLTGQPPIWAKTFVELTRAVQETPPTPPSALRPDTDRRLNAICLRCLAKAPEDRYRSVDELATDLEAYLAGGDPLGQAGREGLVFGGVVAAVALALLLCVFLLTGGEPPPPPSPAASVTAEPDELSSAPAEGLTPDQLRRGAREAKRIRQLGPERRHAAAVTWLSEFGEAHPDAARVVAIRRAHPFLVVRLGKVAMVHGAFVGEARIVIGGSKLQLTDRSSGEVVKRFDHADAVASTPDGNSLFFTERSQLHHVAALDGRRLGQVASLANATALAVSSDGRHVAVASRFEPDVWLYEVDGLREVTRFGPFEQTIHGLRFTPDSHAVLVSTDVSTRLQSGPQSVVFRWGLDGSGPEPVLRFTEGACDVDVAANGLLAITDGAGRLALSSAGGRPVRLQAHGSNAESMVAGFVDALEGFEVAFSPDGSRLYSTATTENASVVRTWDPVAKRLLHEKTFDLRLSAIDVSWDGRYLLICGSSRRRGAVGQGLGRVEVWLAESFEP